MAAGRKKVKKITNLIIIDASWSMSSKVTEVIGGVKQIFNQIKEEAKLSKNVVRTIVVDFSGAKDFNVIVDSTDPEMLSEDVANKYATRGWTALYDAIAQAFSMIADDQDGVFVSIMTDGEENSSIEYKSEDIKKLIESAKEKKWEIVFLGTTEAELQNARSIGIEKSIQYDNSGEGTLRGISVMNTMRSAYNRSIGD